MLPAGNTKGRLRAPFLLRICRAVDAVFPENFRMRANEFPTRAVRSVRPGDDARCFSGVRRLPSHHKPPVDHVARYFHAVSRCHHGCGHAGSHAAVFRQAGEHPGAEMVGHRLSARRSIGRAVDARRRYARRDAFAGAQCRRLRGLRHGLERFARLSRPQAESAGAGSGRDRLDRRRHDAGARCFRDAHDHRRRHRRSLCGADGRRIVVGPAQGAAKALAGDRGAGAARFRADAADPARRSPASA